jgi:uncharacterized ParB-like nuclease family protein
MSHHPSQPDAVSTAEKAFRQARWRADLQRLWARLTGRSAELLCYFEVRDMLLPETSFTVGRQEIPLASIVGSVERCSDYTRAFLPLNDSDQGRWTRVSRALAKARALPPIRVYRTGNVYFVVDGNHRVSVARQLGHRHIEADVVQIQARVPVDPDDQPSGLAQKRSYAQFLKATRLDEARPQADLRLPEPEQYDTLRSEIEGHGALLAAAGQPDISAEDAAADWYDRVYLPVMGAIRRRVSPDSTWTEASLYQALRDHHAILEEAVGQEVALELAAADLAAQLERPPARSSPWRPIWRALVAALRY